jgi:hypothetical protein
MDFWRKRPYWWRWSDYKTTYCSVVFTWQVKDVINQIRQREFGTVRYVVGGPAAILKRDEIEPWAEVCERPPYKFFKPITAHSKYATFTTRGCPNQCAFCAVPKIEGDFSELKYWEHKPIVCDNNLLAASRKHFDKVVDGLKVFPWCDFNQGLDARRFTHYHASRFAELKKPKIRFACDNQTAKKYVHDAVKLARFCGLKDFGVYVLIGHRDDPDDALDRLRFIHRLGIRPNPMRYQPLDCDEKNSYVGKNWTNELLLDYVKYWSSLRFFEGIPFKEFRRKQRYFGDKRQENLLDGVKHEERPE